VSGYPQFVGQSAFSWIPPEDVSMRTPNAYYFPIQFMSLSSIGDSGRTQCVSWLKARQPKALSVQVSGDLTCAASDKKVVGGQVLQRVQKGQATYEECRDRLMEESAAKLSALRIELNQATALAFATDNPELARMTKAKARGATKPKSALASSPEPGASAPKPAPKSFALLQTVSEAASSSSAPASQWWETGGTQGDSGSRWQEQGWWGSGWEEQASSCSGHARWHEREEAGGAMPPLPLSPATKGKGKGSKSSDSNVQAKARPKRYGAGIAGTVVAGATWWSQFQGGTGVGTVSWDPSRQPPSCQVVVWEDIDTRWRRYLELCLIAISLVR
jgi:hypothetical protein